MVKPLRTGQKRSRSRRTATVDGADAVSDDYLKNVVSEMKRDLTALEAEIAALHQETGLTKWTPCRPVDPADPKQQEIDRLMALIPGKSTMH
jgi:hypothetical protein